MNSNRKLVTGCVRLSDQLLHSDCSGTAQYTNNLMQGESSKEQTQLFITEDTVAKPEDVALSFSSTLQTNLLSNICQ